MEPLELRARTCCFTGHRNIPIGKTREIAEGTDSEICRLVINSGVRSFGVGGATGYDTLAAKVLFHLREKEFPGIKVILVYPFDGFARRWTRDQKADYERLLPQYNKIVCMSERASREAYLERDGHLVNCSAHCICYCTKGYGGTAYMVRYARQQGLEIHNISGQECLMIE